MSSELKEGAKTLERITERFGPITVVAYICLLAILFFAYNQQERIISSLQTITATQTMITATLERMGARMDALERGKR